MNRMRMLAARLKPRTFKTTMVVSIAAIALLMMTAVVVTQNLIVARVAAEQNMTVMCVATNAPSSDGTNADTGTGSADDDALSASGSCDEGTAALDSDASIDVFDRSDAQYSFGLVKTVDAVTGSFVSTMRAASIVMMIVFGLLALGVAWIVGTALSTRVADVGRQVEALHPDDLHARITDAHGNDEIGRLVVSINGMLDRVQAASEAERRFVSNASHELRTPIAAVETNLDAPLAQGRFPADVEPSVRRALAANRRGAQLVQALLTLSRIQNGVIGETRSARKNGGETTQATDLTGCVNDMIDGVADDAAERGIVINADDLPAATASADRALLELAVGNLIRNAVVHNTDGGSVDVTIATDGGTEPDITLTVTNTTDETLPDDLRELVQPFHRGEHSRISAVPGVGLGLSIVRAACDAMNATLVLSRPGRGMFRATVVFPSRRACCGTLRNMAKSAL
ncbi:HAMP domain-containing histidine kinase [Bifidobacterium sp. 82T10]|uniref:histidine kinase n=1 Tax=Bifidobacterium miconis TaxID=2834435 RepID=A0ABS6WI96_9BIFI|nr:HAMP domain-containing sensor histidine kinase [Bifidobacterium miconis]MBW3092992.1 HAMP domain-containing histidine kinase [Bifidobacterium miconis]